MLGLLARTGTVVLAVVLLMERRESSALSVVVVSINTLSLLDRCLASVVGQPDGDIEVIVVRDVSHDRHRPPDVAALRARYPTATWIDVPGGETVPRMRTAGVANSRGRIVALIEDDCVLDPEWSSAVFEAHDDVHVAVGGAVEPDEYQRALDWAAFLSDYSTFMLPFEAHETWVLPGNNVSYPRRVIADLIRETGAQGVEEVFVHKAWHEAGRRMKADPRIVVRNLHRWAVPDLTSVPFHHARAFAGRRVERTAMPARLLFAMGAVVLPVILTGRIITRVIRRARHRGHLARALGWLLVFAMSWSIGELCGYAAGPGRAARRWR